MPQGDLAELSDVATELGLDDADSMSDNQQARATALISRVSDLFNHEAQRLFLPGTDSVRLKVQYRSPYAHFSAPAFLFLSEVPKTVDKIVDDNGNELGADLWFVVGQEVRLSSLNYPRWVYSFYGGRNPLPEFLTVTYTHEEPVPHPVKHTVAAIVARYMALVDVAGTTAQPTATELQAGGVNGYRARFADWVTKSVALTPEDLACARKYRYPASIPIVVGT